MAPQEISEPKITVDLKALDVPLAEQKRILLKDIISRLETTIDSIEKNGEKYNGLIDTLELIGKYKKARHLFYARFLILED